MSVKNINAPALECNALDAVDFLKWLRPDGPWTLTAITPDGPTETASFEPAEGKNARAWIAKQNQKRNVYYSLNPTNCLDKKSRKDDIEVAEFVHCDIDPHDDETPAELRKRVRKLLKTVKLPAPSAVINSGNGVQLLWALTDTVEPLDVEPFNKGVIEVVGAGAGTQNCDRILRLPGTINWPNAKKRKAGRERIMSEALELNESAYALHEFPKSETVEPRLRHVAKATSDHIQTPIAPVNIDDLPETVRDFIMQPNYARYGNDRSRAVWRAACALLARPAQLMPEQVEAILLNPDYPISEHILDQAHPERAARRTVERAFAATQDFKRDHKGNIAASDADNMRIAVAKLNVAVSFNEFANRFPIEGLSSFGPYLDDGALDRIWLLIDETFRFRPAQNFLKTVIEDDARCRYRFHPVRDYLDGLKWDGKKRLDSWLINYGGAQDSPYVRAIGAIVLVAAVRRVRQPGCKYDELLVLQSEQGFEKSTALEVLAVNRQWFTDHLPLNADPKVVIELTEGKWIVECGELAGMRRGEIDRLKTMLSRNTDRSRMAYGRLTHERQRQFVPVGTTNETEFLKDLTGNRRFWPVKVKRFDLKALRRDRDQLWAEANQREQDGMSIRLDEMLWDAAQVAQEKAMALHPWEDVIRSALDRYDNERGLKIATLDLWKVLGVDVGRMGQYESNQLTQIMTERLGWRRTSNRMIYLSGRGKVSGYVKGRKPWRRVVVTSDDDGDARVELES